MADNRYDDGVFGTDSATDDFEENYVYKPKKNNYSADRFLNMLRSVNWGIIIAIAVVVAVCAIIYVNREAIISAIVSIFVRIVTIAFFVSLVIACVVRLIFPDGLPGRRGRRR